MFGAGLWLLTKYRATQSLTVRPKGVGFDGFNVLLDLGVFNSSPFPISFNSFSGQVTANDVLLGNVSDFDAVTIAPGAETLVSLKLAPQINNITALIKNIFQSSQAQDLRLAGTLQAENITLPVDTVFTTIPAL